MKIVKIILLTVFTTLLLASCLGEQKTVVVQEYGDTDFVNANFKGNKKDFSALPKNLCEFLDESSILKGYYNATSVNFRSKDAFMNKNCQFAVTFFNDDTQFIVGSIFINEDVSEDNWQESWEFKKKRFKSAEYVENLGMAAVWNAKQKKLEIKMKGYTVMITVPPKMTAKNEIDNTADVKNVAIAIAKSTDLF